MNILPIVAMRESLEQELGVALWMTFCAVGNELATGAPSLSSLSSDSGASPAITIACGIIIVVASKALQMNERE